MIDKHPKNNQRLYLLLGASGSGKSLTSAYVTKSFDDTASFGLGDYLQAELGVTREEMRMSAGALLKPTIVQEAITKLRHDITRCSAQVVIVECRNVVVREHGLSVARYGKDVAAGLGFDGIFFLDVSAHEIERRTLSDPQSRPRNEALGLLIGDWERTAAVVLAAETGCELWVLDGNRAPERVAADFQTILQSSPVSTDFRS